MSINNFVRPAPAASGRDRARTRRRALAAAGSAVFHGLVLLAMFGSASGDIVSGAAGGGPQGPVFEVALVGPPASAAASSQSASEAELQPLFAKFRVAPADNAVFLSTGANRDFASMAERLRGAEPPSQRTAQRGNQAQDRAPREVAEEDSDLDTGGRRADRPAEGPLGASSGSTGSLWGRIAPCWRDIAGSARTPVTLEVSLDATGKLALPPKILRAQGARMDEPRLTAEAKALAALAACLPRNDLRFAGQVHRLEFGAGR